MKIRTPSSPEISASTYTTTQRHDAEEYSLKVVVLKGYSWHTDLGFFN
jgi:hypothetical protein